jgi:hypothetical protein
MIARAADGPPSRDSAEAAAMIPRVTTWGSSDTPMTPVDATITSSASHPSARAVSAAMSRATCSPCVPVHAFAHPLLTTIARARPPLAARCSREMVTGAAAARLVVKTAAAAASRSQATTARSGAPLALIPHATPAAVNPAGAQTPPAMRSSVMRSPAVARAAVPTAARSRRP